MQNVQDTFHALTPTLEIL